jgi:hypothetical protein
LDIYFTPEIPDGPGADLARDSATRVVWKLTSSVVGMDAKFYSLARTAEHYELIRWNLDELPKQTFPSPANVAPVISPVEPQSAKVGHKLKVIIGVDDVDAESPLLVSAEDVPNGATFVPRYGLKKAALVWTPTEADVGNHTITIVAEDDMCKKSQMSFIVEVVP